MQLNTSLQWSNAHALKLSRLQYIGHTFIGPRAFLWYQLLYSKLPQNLVA